MFTLILHYISAKYKYENDMLFWVFVIIDFTLINYLFKFLDKII